MVIRRQYMKMMFRCFLATTGSILPIRTHLKLNKIMFAALITVLQRRDY